MNDAKNETGKPHRARIGCIIAVVLTLGVTMTCGGGGLFLINRTFHSFDSRRDMLCIRKDLVVEDAVLRFSPGFDSAMWCKFTAKVDGIDEAFDASKVDASEFNRERYDFRVDWINDEWWDVDSLQLMGGDVRVGGDSMRVGYVDNNDGTLTIYVFWFEV